MTQESTPFGSPMGLSQEPVTSLEVFEAQQAPTLVLKVHGQPMDRMPEVFDTAFRAIFPAMAPVSYTHLTLPTILLV